MADASPHVAHLVDTLHLERTPCANQLVRTPRDPVMALCASVGVTRAWADDPRSDARTHYQAGVKFYAAATTRPRSRSSRRRSSSRPRISTTTTSRSATTSSATPSPRSSTTSEYLDKVPDAPKRAEIEASMARLDGALKSAAAKKADEAKKADDAKSAPSRREAARRPTQGAKKADDARHADDAEPTPRRRRRDAGVGGAVVAVGAGSTGTPSTGQTVSTGDAQLDRVQGIDIDAIRDQRMGAARERDARHADGAAIRRSEWPERPNGPNGATPNEVAPAPNGMAAMRRPQRRADRGRAAPTDKPVPRRRRRSTRSGGSGRRRGQRVRRLRDRDAGLAVDRRRADATCSAEQPGA